MFHKMYIILLFVFCNIYVESSYAPTGDEVQAGSVLLPASRRGRYLANIVRRQAVDGTGIKFNKDADRMNAEAKKKVDVLSDELLPYIIAEQERRITLHNRVMTAIQNGEKGVTIAEIRNKPPVLIKKGVMYRCPLNRAPLEPDGSGVLLCDNEIVPTQIIYDSCLSVEDRDLYVTRNDRYFFCNRHKTEGPDLPYNGSTIIGCAPTERTSLNYTRAKCTLEDSEDVVVHYRYYPDRTFKYVTELDPDREVCDHWNPCQIGYIFSIPSIDQGKLANDLWDDQPDLPDTVYQNDEIVEPVPEDSQDEYVHPSVKSYTTSLRRLSIPDGGEFVGIRVKDITGTIRKINTKHVVTKIVKDSRRISNVTSSILIKLVFETWKPMFYGNYYCIFKVNGKETSVRFINILQSAIYVREITIDNVLGDSASSKPQILYMCARCIMRGIMVRSVDDAVYNLDTARSQLIESTKQGKVQQFIQLFLHNLKPQEYGDYFAIMQNGDGIEERVKIASVISPEKDSDNLIKVQRISASVLVGGHYDSTLYYMCESCEATDIVCNSQSVVSAGRVSLVAVSNMFSFNFPRFEDAHSCVYIGFFKLKDKVYKKTLAVFENGSPAIKIMNLELIPPPRENQPFEHDVTFDCEECSVESVIVNGVKLQRGAGRRWDAAPEGGEGAFFESTDSEIQIRIAQYKPIFEGVYQAIFLKSEGQITKNILEIGVKDHSTKDATTPDSGKLNFDDTTIKPDETTKSDENPKEETTTPNEAPKPDGADTPKPDGTPKPDETQTPDETHKPDENNNPDETHKTDETHTPDDTAKPDETHTPDETPKSDDANPEDARRSIKKN